MINSLKKMIVMVIAFTMISGALLVMIPQAGESSLISDERYPDPIAIYADPEMRYRALNELIANADGTEDTLTLLETEMPMVENLVNGTTRNYIASDDTASTMEDYFYVESMTKRGEGQFCEVWVADELGFFNPMDVRNPRMVITDDDVEYIISEFDENIYPVMSEAFSAAPEINGSMPYMPFWEEIWGYVGLNATEQNVTEWLFPTNDTGKLMIMIFNIRDENYYDPAYRPYIVGYYSSTLSWLYDRNIMHIDAYDWANRTGEQSDIPDSGHYSYVYESTVAHEYQHLLHDWVDSGEESWVNEGLSMMAEPLCGYPIPYTYVADYLSSPTNSLVRWGDQGGENILADYGAAYMFMQYLADHYGGLQMLQAVFNSMEHGTDSIDEAFLTMGHNRMTFEKVFRDWRMANLNLELDLDIPGGLYYYNTLDPEEIDGALDISNFPVRDHPDYDSGRSVGAYGTDYTHFSGQEQSGTGWTLYDDDGAYWVLEHEDDMQSRLIMELDLTDWYVSTMQVYMYMSLESGYDYGYVQVSTNGGDSWSTLQSDNGHYGWGNYYFSLSGYYGQEIMVGFLYTSDGSVPSYWNINNIYLDGNSVNLYNLYNEAGGFDDLDLENMRFIFDGADEAPESWEYYPDYGFWYSGSGDELDRMLTMNVDLTVPAGEEGDYLHWLNLTTYWEIEQNWDFGFVQVSTDGGLTWTSLNDTDDWCTEEVDMDAMPGIVENVPGITGMSEDVVDLSFDLSAYDGQEIMVGFRYMTDWSFSEEGWYIFGVAVDGVEANLTDMTQVFPEVDWMVTIFVPGNEYYNTMIIDIPVNDLDEVGYKLMATFLGYEEFYVLVSPNLGPVGYWYGVEWRGPVTVLVN